MNQTTTTIHQDEYDEYRIYNTGDQIWLKNGVVVQVQTHDGLFWSEGSEIIQLVGLPKGFFVDTKC